VDKKHFRIKEKRSNKPEKIEISKMDDMDEVKKEDVA